MSFAHIEVFALWLVYLAAASATLWLARRVAPISGRVCMFLLLAPLVFTGEAMLRGGIYGPADLYYGHDPWKRVAADHGVTRTINPILSDLAFANLPWRAAVREALANGRFPLWNRFVLAGNPLLGAAQAGIFHPSTWLAIFLPLPLSWTFSCTFTIFLALLSCFLFFFDFRMRPLPALVGAVGWGFSTYVLFWDGWSVGPSIAAFPLLLLGLRRLASGGDHGIGLTVAALLLSLAGGHPEIFLHVVATAGVYFVWELFGIRSSRTPHTAHRTPTDSHRPPRTARRAPNRIPRALGSALLAGALAFLLAGPQLFPLLEGIRHSSEYRVRRSGLASGRASQSVSTPDAAARLLPAVLPFAHGIYGKSPVQGERKDGSGMPLAYGGAVLFPLAAWGLSGRTRRRARPQLPLPPEGEEEERGRSVFAAFLVAGLLFGASAPGLIDVVSKLPVFDLALNYRLVFLASLGLAGLAAFGAQRLCREESSRGLAVASVTTLILLALVFLASRGVFRSRELPAPFVGESFAWEVAPLILLAAVALLFPRNRRPVLIWALLLLVTQRAGEMGGVYPTFAAETLAPALPELAKLPPDGPWRIVATADAFRPNGAALYGLEDARGYESLLLDRFADIFPIWSKPQWASFNRVDDLSSPFLSFLNVRFAFASPDAPLPEGWQDHVRGRRMAVFENARVLPRAFAPKTVRLENDPAKTLAAMAAASDFSEKAWVHSEETGERSNGPAEIAAREVGPDLLVTVSAAERVLIATSLPDWPGWTAESGSGAVRLATVNHAFVGFWIGAGQAIVRLHYRPPSFSYGLGSFVVGIAAAVALGFRGRQVSRS